MSALVSCTPQRALRLKMAARFGVGVGVGMRLTSALVFPACLRLTSTVLGIPGLTRVNAILGLAGDEGAARLFTSRLWRSGAGANAAHWVHTAAAASSRRI